MKKIAERSAEAERLSRRIEEEKRIKSGGGDDEIMRGSGGRDVCVWYSLLLWSLFVVDHNQSPANLLYQSTFFL